MADTYKVSGNRPMATGRPHRIYEEGVKGSSSGKNQSNLSSGKNKMIKTYGTNGPK